MSSLLPPGWLLFVLGLESGFFSFSQICSEYIFSLRILSPQFDLCIHGFRISQKCDFFVTISSIPLMVTFGINSLFFGRTPESLSEWVLLTLLGALSLSPANPPPPRVCAFCPCCIQQQLKCVMLAHTIVYIIAFAWSTLPVLSFGPLGLSPKDPAQSPPLLGSNPRKNPSFCVSEVLHVCAPGDTRRPSVLTLHMVHLWFLPISCTGHGPWSDRDSVPCMSVFPVHEKCLSTHRHTHKRGSIHQYAMHNVKLAACRNRGKSFARISERFLVLLWVALSLYSDVNFSLMKWFFPSFLPSPHSLSLSFLSSSFTTSLPPVIWKDLGSYSLGIKIEVLQNKQGTISDFKCVNPQRLFSFSPCPFAKMFLWDGVIMDEWHWNAWTIICRKYNYESKSLVGVNE